MTNSNSNTVTITLTDEQARAMKQLEIRGRLTLQEKAEKIFADGLSNRVYRKQRNATQWQEIKAVLAEARESRKQN